jgi:hypothetical protein
MILFDVATTLVMSMRAPCSHRYCTALLARVEAGVRRHPISRPHPTPHDTPDERDRWHVACHVRALRAPHRTYTCTLHGCTQTHDHRYYLKVPYTTHSHTMVGRPLTSPRNRGWNLQKSRQTKDSDTYNTRHRTAHTTWLRAASPRAVPRRVRPGARRYVPAWPGRPARSRMTREHSTHHRPTAPQALKHTTHVSLYPTGRAASRPDCPGHRRTYRQT